MIMMKENRKIFVKYIQILKNKKIVQTVKIAEVMRLEEGEEIAEILLNDFSGDNYVLTYNSKKKLKNMIMKNRLRSIFIGVATVSVATIYVISCQSCQANKKLKNEILNLKNENQKFKKSNTDLKLSIFELNKKIKELQKYSDDLKNENQKFKSNNFDLKKQVDFFKVENQKLDSIVEFMNMSNLIFYLNIQKMDSILKYYEKKSNIRF